MKISKTTIIIIVIVVAVVAYLIYNKNKERAAIDVGPSAEPVVTGTDVNNLESVIAASGMTSTDAAVVRKFAATLDASATKRERIQSKADQWGVSLAQMAALDALWNKYCTSENGTSVFKPEYTDNAKIKNYYWRLVETIRYLN